MDLATGLNGALSAGNYVALPLSLVGGLAAGLNPCCLALYPAAAGVCCSTPTRPITRPWMNALAFIVGLALAVTVLGAAVVMAGRVASLSVPLRYAIAALPIVMGVHRLGWLRLPMIEFSAPAFRPSVGGAFATGLLLSFIIGPCGTPVLAGVLSYAALSQNIVYSAALLFLFGIGTGLPLFAVGTATGTVLSRVSSGPVGRWIDPFIGVGLIALGFYLLWRA